MPYSPVKSIYDSLLKTYNVTTKKTKAEQTITDDNEGGKQMNKGLLKVLIILGVLAYAISPIDAFPGPVDDLIVIILGVIANRRIAARKEADVIDVEPY